MKMMIVKLVKIKILGKNRLKRRSLEDSQAGVMKKKKSIGNLAEILNLIKDLILGFIFNRSKIF